jgi:hypothetical protein
MSRRLTAAIVCAVLTASIPLVAASSPVITGSVSGIELCAQFMCGEAVFAGAFAGKVGNRKAPGAFWTAINHEDLPTTVGASSAVTGGTWLINTKAGAFAGVVQPGGTLTLNPDLTSFTVSLTMVITSGGAGTLHFTGLLDHGPFPPTIAGTITQ